MGINEKDFLHAFMYSFCVLNTVFFILIYTHNKRMTFCISDYNVTKQIL